MNNLAPPPVVIYPAIHYSDRFPVVKTACDLPGQATAGGYVFRPVASAEWDNVTCAACLDKQPR
jgi:hypothetical protein